MKRRIIIITFLFITPILLISILFVCSPQTNKEANHFTRTYFNNSIRLLGESKADGPFKEVVEMSNDGFVIVSPTPSLMFQYDFQGKLIQNIKYASLRHIRKGFVFIDSNVVFFLDGIARRIYVTNFTSDHIDSANIQGPIFTKALYIGHSKFILKQFIEGVKDQEIVLFDFKSGQITRSLGLTELKYDSGMAEEGKFCMDKKGNLITYVFNKKNRYIVFDSNLKLHSKGKTIDTITTPIIHTAKVKMQKSFTETNGAPTNNYNQYPSVSEGRLYIYSRLKADNETGADFRKNCNIDIYEIKNSKYLGSFYLPKYSGTELTSFNVIDKKLITLFKDKVFIYELPD